MKEYNNFQEVKTMNLFLNKFSNKIKGIMSGFGWIRRSNTLSMCYKMISSLKKNGGLNEG